MKSVSIHQPMYLPWVPYFGKIASSNSFVIFDTVQFPGGKSFTNRNYITSKEKEILLTLPISSRNISDKFVDIKIQTNDHWSKKHCKTIELNYKKTANPELLNKIISLYYNHSENFVDFASLYMREICDILQIKTRFIRSSEVKLESSGGELIKNLALSQGATEYITGIGEGSKRYVDAGLFLGTGISLIEFEFNRDEFLLEYQFMSKNLNILDFILKQKNPHQDQILKYVTLS